MMDTDLRNETTYEQLFQECLKAQKLSYSPYSHFRVGACILLKDGSTILGANIENSSYPLSICAERSAMFSMVLKGVSKDEVVCLSLVTDSNKGFGSPCGACRQVMSELLKKDTPVIIFDKQGQHLDITVEGLLPYMFTPEDLK